MRFAVELVTPLLLLELALALTLTGCWRKTATVYTQRQQTTGSLTWEHVMSPSQHWTGLIYSHDDTQSQTHIRGLRARSHTHTDM